MEDTSILIWGTLFGGIGIGYFIYGKKQKRPVAFFSGVCLFIVPYFINDALPMVLASVALMVLPFVVKI